MNVNSNYKTGSFEQDLELAIKRSLGMDEVEKRDPNEQKRSDKKKEAEPKAEKQEAPAQAMTLGEMMLAKHQFNPATDEQIRKEIDEFLAAQKQKEEKVAEKQNVSSEASEPAASKEKPEQIDLTQEETVQVATQATDAPQQPEAQEKKE